MGTRTALQQSPILTLGLILAALWTVITSVNVWQTADWASWGEYVGQTVAGGVVGLLVLFALLAFVVGLYGELGEEEPGPQPWPPE